MATPGRTRVTRGVPLPAIPEKKKRGPKPGSKHKKKVAGAVGGDVGMSAVGVNDVRVDGLSPQEVLNHRFTRMVDVLVAEYRHQQDLRDAAQAKMDYVDGLYQKMSDGGGTLRQNRPSL